VESFDYHSDNYYTDIPKIETVDATKWTKTTTKVVVCRRQEAAEGVIEPPLPGMVSFSPGGALDEIGRFVPGVRPLAEGLWVAPLLSPMDGDIAGLWLSPLPFAGVGNIVSLAVGLGVPLLLSSEVGIIDAEVLVLGVSPLPSAGLGNVVSVVEGIVDSTLSLTTLGIMVSLLTLLGLV
jgi:hypothetical protein